MTSSVQFRVSSFCSAGGCVAVASDQDGVLVRSSRVDGGPVLAFDREEWAAFLAGVRNGEFDLDTLARDGD